MVDPLPEIKSDRLKHCCPSDVFLSTERLVLRVLDPGDLSDCLFVQALLTSPDWTEHICPMPHIANDVEEAKRYIINRPQKMYREHGVGSLLVLWKAPNAEEIRKMVGSLPFLECRVGDVTYFRVGITGLILREELNGMYDLGFALLPQFYRHGIGKEMATRIIQWAREELGLHRLAAITRESNVASLGLLAKLGFVARKGPLPVWYGSPQVVLELEL